MITHTEDSFPVEMRKCPQHRAWIKSFKQGTTIHRYCPVCETIKDKKKLEQLKEAGVKELPKVRLGKI